MLRCARAFGLKARAVSSSWRKLSGTPLPAIAARRDGTFVILAKVAGDLALVHDPVSGQPLQVEREAFEAQWSGRLVLVARRLDISWFMRAMQKYRALFGEVLSDSLFLQVLALISPLFFSGDHRQGFGASRSDNTRHPRAWARDGLGVRSGAWCFAHACLRAHHKSNRRRVRDAAVHAPHGFTHRILRGPSGGGFCRTRARIGKHPQFSDRIIPHTCGGSSVRLRRRGRNVHIFGDIYFHHSRSISALRLA